MATLTIHLNEEELAKATKVASAHATDVEEYARSLLLRETRLADEADAARTERLRKFDAAIEVLQTLQLHPPYTRDEMNER